MTVASSFAILTAGARAAPRNDGSVYSLTKLGTCLEARHVNFLTSTDKPRPPLPPGISGQLYLIASHGESELGHATAVIDAGWVYGFTTSSLAQKGKDKLAALYYNAPDKLPAWIRAMFQIRKPPTLAAERELVQLIGNVVFVWQYPRHHVSASSRLITACLAISQ
jgi:hypothetical protein